VPRPAGERTCSCGRVCASRSGMLTHGRSCPIERARSRAFVEAIENGLDRPVLDEHCRRAMLAARDGRPHPPVPRRQYGRCYCGRPIFREGEPFCTEHDDTPVPLEV
jgi:hypothetical protein